MSKRGGLLLTIVATILLAHATQTVATEEGIVLVAQPVFLPATEFDIATVSYIAMLGSVIPGQGVRLVTAPNCIPVRGQPEQRNTASGLNIRTGTELSSELTYLFGDTLRVFIDLSEMSTPPETVDPEELIARTVDCVLLTAWYGRRTFDPSSGAVEAKYVNLRVEGPRAYRRYAGTYPMNRVGEKALRWLRN